MPRNVATVTHAPCDGSALGGLGVGHRVSVAETQRWSILGIPVRMSVSVRKAPPARAAEDFVMFPGRRDTLVALSWQLS